MSNAQGPWQYLNSYHQKHTQEYLNRLENAEPVKETDLHSWKISPIVYTDIFFHSPLHSFSLIKRPCDFWNFWRNNQISTKDKDLLLDNGLIKGRAPVGAYFNSVIRKRCPEIDKIKKMYTPKTLLTTLNSIKFPIPKSQEQCQNILAQWKKDPQLPYICGVAHILKNPNSKTRKELQGKISFLHYTYISHLCQNYHFPNKFCPKYLDDDYWNNVLLGKKSKIPMMKRCQMILKKKNLTKKDISDCLFTFNNHPNKCKYLINKSGILPKPHCNDLAIALNKQRITPQYEDCQDKFPHYGLINLSRILEYFKKNNIKGKTCVSNKNFIISNFLWKYANRKAINNKLCFFDPFLHKESCLPFFYGDHPDSKSETNVIEKILEITKGTLPDLKCHIINQKEFKPSRLKYQRGCFLISPANCKATQCPKEIYLHQRKLTNITYTNKFDIPYFNIFSSKKIFSIHGLLRKSLNLKTKRIRHISDLSNFLSKEGKKIIHGQGCIEDLLPKKYYRKQLFGCRPMTFLVENFHEKDGRIYLITLLAIDDHFTPRLIPWEQVIMSVKNYQPLLPAKTWTIYGLYN